MDRYLETEQSKIDAKEKQELYKKRLEILIKLFNNFGLKLACPTDA
jgi:hypothetical protein